MEEKDLILSAYRDKKNPLTINMTLKSHTFGYELYRIILMLADKIIKLCSDDKATDNNVDDFFDELKKNYKEFYNK
jgi:hypothetical protein